MSAPVDAETAKCWELHKKGSITYGAMEGASFLQQVAEKLEAHKKKVKLEPQVKLEPIPKKMMDLDTIEDIDTFKRYAEQMAGVAIKTTALERLFAIFKLIHKPDTRVTRNQLDTDNIDNNCLLGFYELRVDQPTFNNAVRKLVDNKLWGGLSASRDLKKPTWVVYTLLKQIGVRPVKHYRGPREHDPDPKDLMYATRFQFHKATLVKNLHSISL